MRKFAAAAALMIATIPSYAYAALTSFASYTQVQNTRALDFREFAGGPGGTLFSRAGNQGNAPAATAVLFDFLVDAQGGQDIAPLAANFTFNATTNAFATKGTNTFEQGGFTGTFSFIYSGAADFVVNGTTYKTGANLLSGSFSQALLAGILNGSSGGVFDTGFTAAQISYTSDVISFPNNIEKDFALTLTSATPRFNVTGGATTGDLKSFTATSTGTFSADPAPVVNGAVPEMATWAMMVMGFGLIGGTVRSRRIGAGVRLPVRQAEFA